MESILIQNILLEGRRVDILIEGNRISRIGKDIKFPAQKVIDGSQKAVIPSFVNMHTHAGMTLFRGISEDMSLSVWLDEIWKAETKLTEEFVYWGTKLACLEMIKTGTTAFADMYWFPDRGADAVVESGMRASLSFCFLDGGDKQKQIREREECQRVCKVLKDKSDKIQFTVSIHGHYTVCDENMLWATDFARNNGFLLHTHLSETKYENDAHFAKYGVSPTKRLYDMGILGNDMIAAHSLWLSDDDIEMYAEKGVTAVHNINSNLKLASGYRFRYNELRDAGVNVAIGTDGAGSSNNLDMLEAMKTAAFVQKAWRGDPTALPIDELLDMGSANGAKALGLDVGRIEEGALADMLLIDMDSTFFIPNFDFKANLVYSANSSCVDTVICDGKILMEGRKVDGEKEIMEEAYAKINEFIELVK